MTLPSDAGLQPVDRRQPAVLPAVEGALADTDPERTFGEGQATTAPLPARRRPAEQVDELTDVDRARHVTEYTLEQRTAGPAGPGDVDDGGDRGFRLIRT
jgi:hypothetical protein